MQWGAVLVWWVAWLTLLAAGLPIAAFLFRDTERHGAFTAIPLAIVVLLIPTLWIGHLIFGPITVVLGVTVLLAVAITAATRTGVSIPWRPTAELVAVFTAAFLFLLAIRSVDAGAVPGGGEKFLDFGLIQSLLRAEYLPPADHWWAGGRIIYYYGGHLLTATIAIITGTPARLAYNLALSGFYATAVTTVYGFAAAIAAHRNLPQRIGGGLAAFLFAFASNLYTAAGAVATYLYPPAIDDLATATGYDPVHVVVTIESFSYWFASRVIPGTITEFPLFAYLNGDLHAHMTDTSLLLLVAALGFAYYHTPAADRARRRLIIFGAIPFVLGGLTFVNTWSLPAALGLVWLALTLAPTPPNSLISETVHSQPQGPVRPITRELRRAITAGIVVIPVAIIGLLWVAPFVGTTLLAGAGDRGIGLLPDRSGLVAFLIAHGGFLVAFTWYSMGYAVHTENRRLAAILAGWIVLTTVAVLVEFIALALVGPLLAATWYLHRVGLRRDRMPVRRPGYEAVLLIAGAGLVLLVELIFVRDAASPGRFNTVFKVYAQVWPLWAVAGGVALIDGLTRPHARPVPEWVPSRFPRQVGVAVLLTALSLYGAFALFEHFHAYATVWIDHFPLVVALLAVVVLLVVTIRNRLDSAADPWTTTIAEGANAHPILTSVIVALVLFHGAIAVTADSAGAPGPDPTLDALAYVHTWHEGEAPAIEWLLDRPGQPYIVSAPGWDVYGWASQASSLTGLPTVAGWATEGIYRGGQAYAERASDVDLLYRGNPQIRAAMLDAYDVTYIYVGPNERARYASADLDFADEPGITVAYEAPAVTIYAVNQSALITD